MARRMLRSEELEDAVQEIFIALWENAPRFEPQRASERTFVAMIARRKLIDRIRRRSRQPAVDGLAEDGALPDELRTDPLETAESVSRVARAVEQLNPEQQKVLQLSIQNGWTYEQISRMTSLPLGTVKSHARRGLLRVREILRHESDNPVSVV